MGEIVAGPEKKIIEMTNNGNEVERGVWGRKSIAQIRKEYAQLKEEGLLGCDTDAKDANARVNRALGIKHYTNSN